MRDHLLRTLRSVGSELVKENDLISWANDQVAIVPDPIASIRKISLFSDPSLKNSFFLLDLLESMHPGSIEKSYIRSSNPEGWIENARYVVSVARRMGAALFILPEDIVECKSKMIMTFVGSLMALAQKSTMTDSAMVNS